MPFTAKYLAARRERLLDCILARCRADLARGVELELERGRRIVTVAGTLRYVVDPRARAVEVFEIVPRMRLGERFRRRAWAPAGGWEALVPLKADRRLSRTAWSRHWLQARVPAIAHARSLRALFFMCEDGSHSQEWEQWGELKQAALLGIEALLRDSGAPRRIHAQLRDALGVGREIIELALRSRSPREGLLLTSDQLGFAWRHEEELRAVLADSPRLFWLYALALRSGVPMRGREPLQALRHALRELGVGAAAWRWLCGHPRSAFAGLMPGPARELRTLAAGLRLQEAMGYARPLPPALQRELLAAVIEDGDDAPDEVRFRAFLERRRLWRARFDEALRRGGRTLRSASSGRWQPLLGTVQAGPVEAVEIRDARELAREGAAMRHCAGRYRASCAANEMRFFSLREAHSGRRLATAAVHRTEQGWALFDVKGLANADPAPSAVNAAREIAARCAALAPVPASNDTEETQA